ncbi:Atrial natriuretic peptide receptor 1 [Halotydeus destructor]|nr:Atrial natriuretic peptide receptor 1 [Halotydeus destructor]
MSSLTGLKGGVAVVTGAGSGIGRAVCKLLDKEETNVVAVDLNGESAKQTIGQLSSASRHLSFALNVTHKGDVDRTFKAVLEEFKKPATILVNSFIGPACGEALDPVGRMAGYWNLPLLTAGGLGDIFVDKRIFSTVTRLAFSVDRISEFILEILVEYAWQHVSLIANDFSMMDRTLVTSLERHFEMAEYDEHEDHTIYLSKFEFSAESYGGSSRKVRAALESAKLRSRVILLVASGQMVREILLAAHELGMNNGEYTFIGIELIKDKRAGGDFNWYQLGDRRNMAAREMFESFMVISVRVSVSRENGSFVHEVAKRSQLQYGSTITEADINPITAAFYDCVMYAWALNRTLAVGVDPLDGRTLVRHLWNKTFLNGLTGDISVNENGDREADYTPNDLDPETGVMTPIATYYGSKRSYEKHAGLEIWWPSGASGPPPDVPLCGFSGESVSCRPPEPFPVVLTALLIIIVLLVLSGSVAAWVYRKIKLEGALADSWWKVNWEDIEFHDRSARKSQATIGQSESSVMASRADKQSSRMSEGVRVAVKELQVKRITVNRQVLLDLKLIRELTHENLTRFLGMCIEAPNFALLTELCNRGSLRDMLENDAINMDWIMKYSMITDILEGLLFLHNSVIGCHGRLKSANRVIDSRFSVKLTNYGLNDVHKQVMSMEDENFNPRSFFWTAPEHLRDKDPFDCRSKKGDIYAFAVVLQEIITRCGPFEAPERLGRKRAHLGPEEIPDRLRMGTSPSYQPEVAPDEAPAELLDLMQFCWAEDPKLRPNVTSIKPRLRKITKGISSKNFLDNLLNRMEQYANMKEFKVDQGSIVNVSSVVGKVGNFGQTNYSSSKAGVVGLTKSTAKELAKHNIRCNTIMPGFIETPMIETVPEMMKTIMSLLFPLGRKGQAEGVAVAFVSGVRALT